MTGFRRPAATRRLGIAALLVTVVVAGSATAVRSQSELRNVALALRGVGEVLADPLHDRLFISQGYQYNGIVATDLDGAFVAAVDDQPGASGMALSPDGSTLYVALSSANAISALDPTTLVERTRYDLGPPACPGDLAWAGDRLWATVACGTGPLGALDPVSGTWRLSEPTLPGGWKLASSPGAPGTLVLAASGAVHVLAVSDFTATLVRSRSSYGVRSLGLALSPDGTTIYVANGHVETLRTADLTVLASYYRPEIEIGVLALSPDGGAVAVSAPGGAAVLRADTLTQLRDVTYDAGPPLGLAFGASGTRLYAVSLVWRWPGQLSILDGATKLATEITATAKDNTVIGENPVEIRGTLRRRSDGSPLGGRTLQPSRVQDYGFLGYIDINYHTAYHHSPPSPLPPVTTEPDGSYVVRDVPPDPGEFVYTVTWAGDEETLGSTATVGAVKHRPYVDRLDLGLYPGLAYSVAISQKRFPEAHTATTAVIATDKTFADALAGSPLTADGPLLLTRPFAPQLIRDELNRVLANPSVVYVLGGTGAIPDSDLTAFQGPGRVVRRLWGNAREETSVAIAREVLRQHPGTTAALARAWGTAGNPTAAWADSVSGGGWSAEAKVPIVLTPTERLHPAVHEFLKGIQTTVVLGGTAAISRSVEQQVPGANRVAGDDRAGTAAQVADRLWPESVTRFTVLNAYHPNGWIWGLAGAGLAAQQDAPILYSTRDTLPDPTLTAASRARCGDASPFILVGGKDLVGPAAQQQLDQVARTHC